MLIVIIILSVILVIESLSFIYCFIRILKPQKIENDTELNQYHQLQNDLDALNGQRLVLIQDINKLNEKLDTECAEEQEKIAAQIQLYKDNAIYASEQYINNLEQEYNKIEHDFDEKLEQLQIQQAENQSIVEQYNVDIANLKSILNAAALANAREREKEEQLDFYKLSISSTDLEDIKKLNDLKLSFHKPIIINKLIWTTYFQKQTTDMCNRILGIDKVCGIYKITNLNTQQCYIGQSVDIAQRFKEHIKCGLGIEAPATNILYQAMQKDGVWSFTFELLESCERSQLNEKECFWIDLYQSYNLGYNATQGNKTK